MRQQQQQRRGLAFPFPISTSPHPHNPTPSPSYCPFPSSQNPQPTELILYALWWWWKTTRVASGFPGNSFAKWRHWFPFPVCPQERLGPPVSAVLEDEVNFQDLRPVLHSLAKNLSVSLWKALPFKQSINYTNTRALREILSAKDVSLCRNKHRNREIEWNMHSVEKLVYLKFKYILLIFRSILFV